MIRPSASRIAQSLAGAGLVSLIAVSAPSTVLADHHDTHDRKAKSVADSIGEEVHDIFANAKSAVCKITAVDRHGLLHGTGFFIDPTGTVLTIYSVGGESNDITVEANGNKYVASRILADPRSGVVLLKVEAETPFLPLAAPDPIEVASPVVSVGYAMDLDISPTFGTVSSLDLKYLGRYFPTTHIRANLPVARGQAGSPLLNMDGKVVGVIVSAIDGGVGCHALPVKAIEKIKNDYALYGGIRHGWIGVTVEPSIPGLANSSAVVCDIDERAPAAESSLQVGDVLVQIGRFDVDAPEDVLDASFFLTPGDNVDLVVSRDGEKVVIPSTVGDHPANPKLHAHSPTLLEAGDKNTLQLGN